MLGITVAVFLMQTASPPPRPSPTGAWAVSRSASKMDDSPTVTLSLRARTPIRAWPGTVATPTLIFRCKEGEVAAFINMGARAAVEGEPDEATITLRFDKQDAFQTVVGESTDGVAFFLRDPKQFIREASAHSTLLVRFVPFNSQPQETTFALRGLLVAARPLQRACGWDPAADEAAAVANARAEDEQIAELASRLVNLSEPYQRRLLAAYDLNRIRPPVAPSTILALTKALLEDPEETVRIQAATTLGTLGRGHQAAIDALKEASKTGTPMVSSAAHKARLKIE